jgi:hypothetical protein
MVRLAIYATEPFADAIDDYEDATESEVLLFDNAWAKKDGNPLGSPASLLSAIRVVERDPDVFGVLVDSCTDVAHYGRVAYSRKNPGKKIPYATVDAGVSAVESALKSMTKHWCLTFREKDDRDTVDGQEVVSGKRARAAGSLDYIARVKAHCTKTRTKDGVKIACDITDQRGLGDKPSVRLVCPTVRDLADLMNLKRYPTKPDRKLYAQFYGREGTGKSGTAMRLMMALHLAYKEHNAK